MCGDRAHYRYNVFTAPLVGDLDWCSMDIFPLTGDMRAFLLRATASLERVDAAVAEAQLLMRTTTATVEELHSLLAAFRAAAGTKTGGL